MPSLMVTIFAVEVVVALVNSIGAATINQAAWRAYNALPTTTSRDFADLNKLKREYLQCRQALNATSSQDEFAKWAKLRRQHDKLQEQLEKKKSALDATKSSFDRYVTGVRWIATRGLQFFLPFWFAKTPMFWLPYGFFPYYAEWLISFPRAPLGSVSIASWQLACTGFMVLLTDTLKALLALVMSSSSSSVKSKTKEKPVASGAAKAPAADASGEKKGDDSAPTEGKKDL